MPNDAISTMPTIMGNRPIIDTDGCITNLAAKRPVVIVTAATRLVKIEESGTYFINEGTAGSVNFTLPDVVLAIGCEYWFGNCGTVGASGFNFTITGTPIDVMVTDADIDADTISFATASKMVGNSFHVYSDGCLWITCAEMTKVVAGGTIVTVTS